MAQIIWRAGDSLLSKNKRHLNTTILKNRDSIDQHFNKSLFILDIRAIPHRIKVLGHIDQLLPDRLGPFPSDVVPH